MINKICNNNRVIEIILFYKKYKFMGRPYNSARYVLDRSENEYFEDITKL